MDVIKYTTRAGNEFSEPARATSSENFDMIRERANRAWERGDPIYEVEMLEMEEDEYHSLYATNDSYYFFGQNSA